MNIFYAALAGVFAALVLVVAPHARAQPIEVHQRLEVAASDKIVALTLDACSGAVDQELIDFLVAESIPATLFVTKRWLDRNPASAKALAAKRELFTLENHGARHVPAIVGVGRSIFGLHGHLDMRGLVAEIEQGAAAIESLTGRKPAWYRAATAEYDAAAIARIASLGYRVAGFSLNADQGATLSAKAVEKRVTAATSGDILIAHMNKPRSQTAEGLQPALRLLKQQGFRFARLDDAGVRVVQTK